LQAYERILKHEILISKNELQNLINQWEIQTDSSKKQLIKEEIARKHDKQKSVKKKKQT